MESTIKNEHRTFPHFPEDTTCPLCGTNEDKECCLIPIDGTEDGCVCEAQPIHVDCLMDISRYRYNKKAGVVYQFAEVGE